MKKAISAVLCAIMLAYACTGAIAAGDQDAGTIVSPVIPIDPNYVNVMYVMRTISFSGDLAMCDAVVNGKSGTSNINANFSLDRVNSNGSLTNIATWNNVSTNSATLSFSSSRYVTRGYTYKFSVNATVTKNGVNEYISESTQAYCS